MSKLLSKKVRKDKDKDSVFKLLKDSEYGFFQKHSDVYIFAASLAVAKHKNRLPIKSPDASPIAMTIFNEENHSFIDLLALYDEPDNLNIVSHTNDIQIEHKIQCFEEYANAGLQYLKEELIGRESDSYEILKECIIDVLEIKSNSQLDSSLSLEDLLNS